MDVTIVTEAYNLAEGQGYEELQRATERILALIEDSPDREAIVVTPSMDPRVDALVAGRHPRMRLLRGEGCGYDALKNMAADEAQGRYVAYLDGDCVPVRDDWLEQLLKPLRDDALDVACGFTLYEGSGALTAALSVLDFGFLLDGDGASIGCYASNNVAFPSALRREAKVAEEGMRCSCYHHAQALIAAGYRLGTVLEAFVVHQVPSLRSERHRRGYDLVSACWMNPSLPEAGWIAPDETTVTRLVEQNLRMDRKRLKRMRKRLSWKKRFAAQVEAYLPRLRRLDAIGIRRALRDGEQSGATRAARKTHEAGRGARV